MKAIAFAGAVLLVASTASAAEWRNVDTAHYLGGRKASAGYLQGKVVLVARWGANCLQSRALLPQVEELWKSFKTKPFVALGGHCKDRGTVEAVEELVAENNLTYPVYEDAALAVGEPKFDAIPFLYVVDEVGKVVYRGRDVRAATQAIVMALTDMEAPKDVQQWKRFLDYELEHLPCRAYLRLRDFRRRFPQAAKDYAAQAQALAEIKDLKKVADYVEFAKRAKDPPTFGPRDTAKKAKFRKLVGDAILKYEGLKENPDPRVAQEVKNALADLKWTQAAF